MFLHLPPATRAFSLIVLNWNGRHLLEQCLPSIVSQAHPDFEVLVVDNASTDDSVPFVQVRHPSVRLVCNAHNARYAGGMNAGLQQAQGRTLVLLNSDVILRPDWLTQMETVLADEPRIGLAGCKLYYPDERTLQHAGGILPFPDAHGAHAFYRELDQGQSDGLRDVDFVTGAALAVRRETLEQIGLLDEAFTFYFEDVDWAFRARRAGWRVVYASAPVGIHLESASSSLHDLNHFLHFHRGRLRFQLKHYGRVTYQQQSYPVEKNLLAQRTDLNEQRALNQIYLEYLLHSAQVPDLTQPGAITAEEAQALSALFGDLRSQLRARPISPAV